ncbi:4938_t:CDS:2 [Entrophospora sp. SA101]|nr:4938_t:CDS:2 [Entrophospora sp. SA101]
MNSLVLTPLLNDPSSFYCENNNNITWLLTRLEKRINQIEENIYNLLGKLFIRVERLESNVDLYFDKVYSTRQ